VFRTERADQGNALRVRAAQSIELSKAVVQQKGEAPADDNESAVQNRERRADSADILNSKLKSTMRR